VSGKKKSNAPMVNPPPMEAPEPVAREWRTSVDKSTGRFFVRDPITDEITPVEREEAEKLLLHQGYQPVDEDSAKEYHKAELYKQYGEDNPLEAVTTGLTRGLTGGLEDFAMEPDDAKLRQAVVDEHPWLAGLSEAGSTLGTLALSGGASGLARLTPVGALAHGGELLTKGVSKAIPLTSVARGVGTAAEGAVYGGIQAARDAHMYEEPLTVQQIGSQMMGGAIFGGALGGGFGLLEKRGASMGSRLAKAQEERLTAALKPGLDDHELVAILKAEGIDVTPSALKVFQAGLYNDKDITPELLALADDRGPVGEALRKRLANGGQDRAAAEARLAEALQAQHERDDVLRAHYGGRLKKQHFKNLIDDSDASSMEQVFKANSPDSINTMAEHVAKADAGTRADMARALGVSEKDLADKVRTGLATRDNVVQKAVADVLKEHPLHTVAPGGATRPVVANDQELITKLGGEPTVHGPAGSATVRDVDTRAGTRLDEATTIDRDTVYDPKLAKADLREQAGLGTAYHELGELDKRYPALGLQAREAVKKHGLTQEGWKELAKNYPALETGEAMRLLARAKQEIEATGATFGRMGGVIPGDPMPNVAARRRSCAQGRERALRVAHCHAEGLRGRQEVRRRREDARRH
jgi:ribosomal protein L12E/L44/L45/RPP1/RPP2